MSVHNRYFQQIISVVMAMNRITGNSCGRHLADILDQIVAMVGCIATEVVQVVLVIPVVLSSIHSELSSITDSTF